MGRIPGESSLFFQRYSPSQDGHLDEKSESWRIANIRKYCLQNLAQKSSPPGDKNQSNINSIGFKISVNRHLDCNTIGKQRQKGG
jgi:hypothetical protein